MLRGEIELIMAIAKSDYYEIFFKAIDIVLFMKVFNSLHDSFKDSTLPVDLT